jgi:hypothetical protein
VIKRRLIRWRKDKMECIMSFWDFCPKDRLYLVLVILACIGLGYIIGTGGRWKRNFLF